MGTTMEEEFPMHTGYCVKCKEKRSFEEAERTVMKNGANMAKGKCPVCGTTVTRILPKAKSDTAAITELLP